MTVGGDVILHVRESSVENFAGFVFIELLHAATFLSRPVSSFVKSSSQT